MLALLIFDFFEFLDELSWQLISWVFYGQSWIGALTSRSWLWIKRPEVLLRLGIAYLAEAIIFGLLYLTPLRHTMLAHKIITCIALTICKYTLFFLFPFVFPLVLLILPFKHKKYMRKAVKAMGVVSAP